MLPASLMADCSSSPSSLADPAGRLHDLDLEGFERAVLFPTFGLMVQGVTDRAAANALCRALNDWLADFCAHAPQRLIGVATLPMLDPADALAEARRCVEGFGFRGVFRRPEVIPGAPKLHDVAWAPLWTYLDALHPHLWRAGKQFPQNSAAIRQMMSDGELLLALTFNPNEAANEIAAKRLADSIYSYQLTGGTLGNTHFLAIPFNASAKEGAQVLANFLLSPLAQARKADIAHWGDPTVLALDKLPATERARFAATPQPGQVEQTMPTIPEPHGSWVDPLEKEWLSRYG